MRRVYTALMELSIHLEITDDDDNIHDEISKGYPFTESLEDVVVRVGEWITTYETGNDSR